MPHLRLPRMLLVILTTLTSDGHGTSSGGVSGERWRSAMGRAAAVAIPLRVLFEHAENGAPGAASTAVGWGMWVISWAHGDWARSLPVMVKASRSFQLQHIDAYRG